MAKVLEHSFTINGWIEKGSPCISWSVSHIKAHSIEDALEVVYGMFTTPVIITDVHRIITQEKDE